MATKVSAETITAITAAPGFHDPSGHHAPPATETLIRDIRNRFRRTIENARQGILPPRFGMKPRAAADVIAEAVRQQETFDQMLGDIPAGYKLVPVFFSRIPAETNTVLMREYEQNVRARFLRFLATEYADELVRLGIAPCGIERMREGFDPVDEQGRYYEISVDHIIERAGCGQWADVRTADPKRPAHHGPASPVNHFSNLILMPEDVHQYKNRLNALQNTLAIPAGQGSWVLMLAPETGNGMSGYVSQPQPAAKKQTAVPLKTRPDNDQSRIGRMGYLGRILAQRIEFFYKQHALSRIMKPYEDIAARRGKTVADLANDNRRDADAVSLRQAFGRVANHPFMQDALSRDIRPLLAEATKVFARESVAVLDAARKTRSHRAARTFMDAFNGRRTQQLRAQVGRLPLKEAQAFLQTMRDIDKRIADYTAWQDAAQRAAQRRRAAGDVNKQRRGSSGGRR